MSERWPRSSTMTTTLHGFTKCDCVNKFFLTEGSKNILIHTEKSPFPFSNSAHRDFEIFKKAVLYFCGEQPLAEVKGLGRSMDCSAKVCPSWKSRTTRIFKDKEEKARLQGPRRRSALRKPWRLFRHRLWWFCSGGRWCQSWYAEGRTRFPFCIAQNAKWTDSKNKAFLWT